MLTRSRARQSTDISPLRDFPLPLGRLSVIPPLGEVQRTTRILGRTSGFQFNESLPSSGASTAVVRVNPLSSA